MPDLQTARNELNVCLRLSFTASNEEQAQKALALAEGFAQRLPPHVVREVLSEIEQEIQQDGDPNRWERLCTAVERLADGESDELGRARLRRMTSSLRG